MERFRGGLVFKARRLVYHSILGSRVIKKKKKDLLVARVEGESFVARLDHLVKDLGFV